jgi:hypothetical protein
MDKGRGMSTVVGREEDRKVRKLGAYWTARDDLALQRKFHYKHGMALHTQCRFEEAIEELKACSSAAPG